ncbi:hypothetical protein BC332_02297 [Capsicum chinense]|nr:hypothetical protein BC332_02297 [Capsicum chinense]
MRVFSTTINAPWAITGDFNSILSKEEKMGGKPYRLSKSIPFIECLHDCGLRDIGYTGNTFTWCNERKGQEILWKRLDRMMCNEKWDDYFSFCNVQHMTRISSDHCRLVITLGNNQDTHIKYFCFLNFWTDLDDFHEVVKSCWTSHDNGNIFWQVQQKLKRTSKALTYWSKIKVGNVKMNTTHIRHQINKQTLIISHKQFKHINPFMQWDLIYTIMENAKDHIEHIPVRWSCPKTGALKLNSNGCVKGNPGQSGGGVSSEMKMVMENLLASKLITCLKL